MNNRRVLSIRGRKGYVSLLAMSFAFGLAVFGSALAVGLRAYLVASASEQRDILDRITLESAAHEMLGRLAAGEVHSIRPMQRDELGLNQRRVAIGLSLPEGKRDLKGDPDSEVLEVLQQHGLVSPNRAQPAPSVFETLESMSRAWRLSADKEDCLRQVATVGRAPEEFRPAAAAATEDDLDVTRTISAGDQVDLRVSLTASGVTRTLWIRARFTGATDSPWRFHDYRRLTLKTTSTCRVGE